LNAVEQFYKRSDGSKLGKVQRFKVTFWYNEKHSKPTINTGMQFDLSNSKVTSEAVMPTVANIALAK